MRKNDLLLRVMRALEAEGRLRPECLVEDSRSKKHPLHKHFRWDDDKGLAMEARLDIARRFFASCRIIHTVEERRVSAVAYVKDPTTQDQGYVSVSRARTLPDMALDILTAEVERIKGSIERAREVAAALDLSAELDRLLESAEALAARSRSRRGPAAHEARTN